MNGPMPDDPVRSLVARPLRYGTLVAVAVIAVGLLASLGQPVEIERDPVPLLDAVAAGGGEAVTAIGLLLLCLVPLAVTLAAAAAFARRGEPRYLGTSLLVAALLAASLIVPALLLTR
jgi:uncharacterized membrane protein